MDNKALINTSLPDRKKIRKRKWTGRILDMVTSVLSARISYLSLILLSALFSAFYLQSFFYMITILLISLPVFSFILTKYTLNHITPQLSYSPPMAEKDGASTLLLTINNTSYLPVSCLEITLTTASSLYMGCDTVTHSLQLRPGKVNELKFPVFFKKYGIYTAVSEEFTIFDYLHLFSFTKSYKTEASLSVMPENEPVTARHDLIYEEGFDEFTDNERRGNVSGNVTDIREYRPGDRLSRIHWKLTEKMDSLIVKENEATSSNEFIVLLELYQPSKEDCDKYYSETGSTDKYDILDNAIKEARSVSTELLLAGEAFVFMFYDKNLQDFVSSLIRSEEELNEIFTQAFYAGSYTEEDQALTIYNRSGLNKGTLIHVK
ncbi:MAG: DUF58 domain-containing protein [Lachnospiraceae bacterium]|nr:DUF58 domain-containing protein [Lachnospiraceae bacterium]